MHIHDDNVYTNYENASTNPGVAGMVGGRLMRFALAKSYNANPTAFLEQSRGRAHSCCEIFRTFTCLVFGMEHNMTARLHGVL